MLRRIFPQADGVTAAGHRVRTGRRRWRPFEPRTLAVAVAGAFAAGGAWAQIVPSGGVAIHGQASISAPASNQLVVTTTNGAGTGHSAINWQSFSLSAGSSARFVQPNAASLSINRVVTNTPSAIFGNLSSNGRLVLVNQSGITVGAGAVVDTAGFTASALRMTDADALAGRLRFGASGDMNAMGGAAGLTVDGRITARDGDVVLIAPRIDVGTSALVQSPNGSTILAAGQQVEITGRGLEGISLLVQARDNEARNLGRLEGDAVGIFAGTLRHSGGIQATTASLEGGTVVLKATGDSYVEGSGSIIAKGTRGGTVDVLGNRVAVKDQAMIDVSGAQGGGTMRIGGDYQGKNPDVPNAARTYLGPEAVLRADAVESGDGGRVIVWADDLTKAYGSISARGGAMGGGGGFVEVSGKHGLVFEATVDLRAPFGKLGTLLLDPDFIDIVNGGSDPASSGDEFTDGPSNVSISPATLNAVGGNVMLQSDGDITFSDPVNLTTPGASLTALTGNMLSVNASITTNGGNILLYSAAPGALGTGTSDNDAIYVNAAITSNGGTIELTADSCNLGCDSVVINANVNAGAGTIFLNGLGDVRQTALGVLAGGSLFVNADSTIILDQLGNNIPGDVNLFTNIGTAGSSSVTFRNSAGSFNLNGAVAKGNVSLDGTGTMTTDGVIQSTTGNISIVFVGGMNFGDDVVAAGALTLGSTNSIISQTGGGLTVAGASTVNAGAGDIDLTSLLNNMSTVSLTGGHITLFNAGSLTVTTLSQTADRNLYLESGGVLSLPAGAINRGTGQLSLLSGAGNLSTPGALSGSDLLLSGQGGLTLAHTISATGTLSMFAGGSVTQTAGAIVALGATTVDSGLFNVTLTQTGNDFSSIGATGGAVSITDANGVVLSAVDASGLTVNASGNVTQNAAVIVGGTTTINAGTGNVSLTTAGNNLNNLNVSGNALVIVEGAGSALNVLSLSSGVNQPVSLTAGHNLTLPGTAINTGTAILYLDSGNTLTIQGALSGQTILLEAVAGLVVNAPITANGDFVATVSGVASTMTVNRAVSAGAEMELNLAGNLSVLAGSDGLVGLTAGGNQTITAGGNILLQGGGSGDSNAAVIETTGAGSQSVTANGITVLGGAGGGGLGIGNYASIRTAGSQTVTVGNGGITMTGGGGTLSENYASIEQNGGAGTTQSITINGTGSIVLTGGSALGNRNHASILSDNGDSQTFTFTGGGAGRGITLTGGTNGSDAFAEIYAGTGIQTITGAGLISLTGGASGGGISFGSGDTLGNLAAIGADTNNQTIIASGIVLQGGAAGLNNLAGIFGGGDQLITVGTGGLSLTGGGGGGSDLKNAAILWKGSDVPGTSQTIRVGGGGSVTLQGGSASRNNVGTDVDFYGLSNGAFAAIRSEGIEQLIEFTAPGGSINMTGGTVGSANVAFVQAITGSQTIRGSDESNAPAISLTGGASGGIVNEGNRALIGAELGSQNISAGSISITGGVGGTENLAQIRQGGVTAGLGETQTISIVGGGNMAIQGGGGSTNLARVQAYGVTQMLDLGSGGSLDLTGGTGASFNFARVIAENGSQTITGTADITVRGGASGGAVGSPNFAEIRTRVGAQSIAAGSLTIVAGAGGIDNSASVTSDANQTISLATAGSNALTIGDPGTAHLSNISGHNQIVTAGTGGQSGSITVVGGTAAGKSSGIFNKSGTQTISTTGILSLTGGTASGTSTCNPASSGSCGYFNNEGAGLQTITAQTLLMQGGFGGGGNGAGIFVTGGNQQINVGSGGLTMTAGAGGTNNFATIGGSGANGSTLNINVAGDTVMDSRNGDTGSGALIGLGGTGDGGSVTINFIGTGDLNFFGSNVSGSQAGAGMGAATLQTNATATVNISADNITFLAGSQGAARIAPGPSGSGNISLTAAGDIAFNTTAPGVSSGIVTSGNVTLTAGGGITASPDAAIVANLLTATAQGGSIVLDSIANDVDILNATVPFFNSGDILFTNGAGLTLAVSGITMAGTGRLARITADDIQLTGAVSNAGGTVVLRPLDLARNVHVENSPTAGVLSLSPADLQRVTNANVLEIGRLDGTGNLLLGTGLASTDVGASTLRLLAGSDFFTSGGAGLGAPGTEFNHHVEVRANNDLSWTQGGALLVNNRSLSLYADNDGDNLGSVNIGAVTLQVGTDVNNGSGTMDIKGADITIAVSGNGAGLVRVTGTGSQTLTSTVGGITLSNSNAGSGALNIETESGTQTLSAAPGTLSLQAGTGAGTGVTVRTTGGNQVVSADTLTLQGGASGSNNTSALFASGAAQTITVGTGGMLVQGGGGTGADGNNSAFVTYAGTGAQNISITGAGNLGIVGGSSALQNVGTGNGSRAAIDTQGTGNQTITLTGGDLTLQGGSVGSRNYAAIFADLASQTITGVNNLFVLGGDDGGVEMEGNRATVHAGINQTISASNISLVGGDAGTENYARFLLYGPGALTQSVSAFNSLNLTGGADGGGIGTANRNIGNRADLISEGNQNLTVGAGGITMTAGGGSLTNNQAQIFQSGTTGTSQTITMNAGGSISLTGGSSAATGNGSPNGGRAILQNNGDSQLIDFISGGSLSLIGGTVGSRNFALVHSANGTQTIRGASTISLTGGANGGIAGEGNFAQIQSDGGAQSISAASITLTGGAGGIESIAAIRQGTVTNPTTASQTIAVTGGGALSLTGGSGTTNFARIQAFGTSQTINMDLAAPLTLTGGTGASNNFARVQAVNGNQTINGIPTISISGGANGGADLAGNFADIRASGAGATQTLNVNTLLIQAGAAGQENFAGVMGANQTITVVNDVGLIGGGSSPSLDGTSGGGARIGGSGDAATNLTLTLGGDLTLTGGSVAGAALGSSRGGGQPTNIIAAAGGDITLNPGSAASAGSRIGSPAVGPAAGDIFLSAGGTIALGGTVAGETAIRTLGDVTLDAATLAIGNLVTGATLFANATGATAITGVGQISASALSGDAIELVTGTSFSNSAGASALVTMAPARWLVYSANPALDTRGGLVYDFKQYDKVFGDATAIAASGNGFIYAIAPTATVSLTGTVSKVYDGNDVATLLAGNFLASGGIDGDTVSVGAGATGSYDNRHVGTGKTVSVSGVTISALDGTAPVFGYALAGGTATGAVGIITAAPLTVSTGAVNKSYDATTGAPGAAPIVTAGALLGGDTLSGGSFAFLDPHAGIGKTVTVSGVTVNDGNGGLNYTVTQADNTASSITAANLLLGTSNVVKTYDGNISASGSLIVTGGSLFGSDSVSGGSFAFTDRNAGIGNKIVTVAGASVNDGNGGANYIVGYTNNTSSTINRADISSVTGITAANKVYDGNTTATLAPGGAVFNGMVGGDMLTVGSASGAFANRNVGTAKPVAISAITLSGADAGNYNLLSSTGSTSADISQASITVGTSAVSKPYDGTTGAAGSAIITGGALVGGDTLSGGVFAFLDPNVGNGKTVTVSGVNVSDGNGGANYAISFTNNTVSSITALAASTWSGLGGDSLWSNPANWDVLPITGNVLSAAIPAGVGTVVFDAAAGTTSLLSLISQQAISVTGGSLVLGTSFDAPSLNQSGGTLQVGTSVTTNSLVQSAGTLQVGTSLTTGSLAQSGGNLLTGGNVTAGSFTQGAGATLSGAGALTVSSGFGQSGGSVTMGSNISINQSSGNLVTANLAAPSIALAAPAGAISQSGSMSTTTLSTQSATGTNLNLPANQIGTLVASNSGAGDIVLVNASPLTLGTIANAGGNITVTNTGAINSVGPVSALAGSVTIIANSPLTVGSGGIIAGGDIVLHATNLTSAGNLTLNGALLAGNTVSLTADANLVQNFAVVGANGVTATAAGSMTYGPLATTNAPPILYMAGGVSVAPPPTVQASALQPPGDIIVTFLELLQQAIDGPRGDALQTNPDGSKKRKDEDEGIVTEEELCR